MNKNLIFGILILVFAAGGFYGGMKYQQSKTISPERFQRQNNQTANNMRPVNGEILSVDDQSVTVKLMDGSSKIVLITTSTTINKTDPATRSDLKVGESVAAFGIANSDGTVTANSIQLNPMRYNNDNVGR